MPGKERQRARKGDPDGNRLSPREREIIVLVAEGLRNRDIASRLGLSPRTVEKHRQRITDKTELRGAAQLTKLAVAMRWIVVP